MEPILNDNSIYVNDVFPHNGEMGRSQKFHPVFEELKEPLEATPFDVFRALSRKFAPQTDVFFFRRSGQAGKSSHHTPTQTLLAIDPFELIQAAGGKATIRNASGSFELPGTPFEILSRRLEEYRTEAQKELPFFQGGALGYFAYDSVRWVEPTLQNHPGNLRELSLSKDAVDAEFGLYRKLVIFDHLGEKIFLMSGYLSDRGETQAGRSKALQELQELKALCLGAQKTKSRPITKAQLKLEIPLKKMVPMLGKQKFVDGVKRLKEHIRAGDIFQAVLSERFTTSFAGRPLDLFETLSEISPAPYQFYFTAGSRVFMGASPEMLARLTQTELETHPIAGTRPRGATPQEEKKYEQQLKRSEKEKSEHLMLVDLARNDMGRVSDPGTVRVNGYMELKRFAGVIHLVSTVTGKLKKAVRPVEALASFFPAGTLSGAPKVRAMQILSELEPDPRGFYGGAVVAASFSGDLDSCIAIRSIQVENGEAIVRAGAGIVADSRPESEYAEVQHKSRMARRALAIVAARRESARGELP